MLGGVLLELRIDNLVRVVHLWNLDSLLSHPRPRFDRCCQWRRSGRLLLGISDASEVGRGLATYIPHDEVRVLACSWLCSFHPLWVRSFHPLWVSSFHPLWVRSFHPLFRSSFASLWTSNMHHVVLDLEHTSRRSGPKPLSSGFLSLDHPILWHGLVR